MAVEATELAVDATEFMPDIILLLFTTFLSPDTVSVSTSSGSLESVII
jgi:hypothetical protein